MDNFKAYNDAYGFSNGDRMIRALADSMRKIGEKEAFLGHIGGDDFVMITRNLGYPAALGTGFVAVSGEDCAVIQ